MTDLYNRTRAALYEWNGDYDPSWSQIELVSDCLRDNNPDAAIGYIYADMSERQTERWYACCENNIGIDYGDDRYDDPDLLEDISNQEHPLYLLCLLTLTDAGKKTDIKYRDKLMEIASDLIQYEVIQESDSIKNLDEIVRRYTEISPAWKKGVILTELRQMCEGQE